MGSANHRICTEIYEYYPNDRACTTRCKAARDGTSTAVLLPDLDATICLLQLTNDVQRTARCIARTETKCRSNGRTTCLRAWLVAYEGRSTTGWLEGPWLRDKRNRHLRQWNPSNNPPYTHKGIFSRSGFEEDKTSVAKTAVEKPAVQIQHPILAVVGSYAEGPSISFAAQIHSPRSSTDGGITWTEYSGNPVISQPPTGWNITGFRDPFFHDSPELDAMLNYTEPHYYAIFGSGIGDVGPRIPLYTAPSSNLTRWTYLGALWEPKGNTSLGRPYEVGNWGWNFEVPNFFNLGGHWFFSAGAQGASRSYHEQTWVVWNEANVSVRPNGSIAFEPLSMGASDWGNLYAVSHDHASV